MNKFYGFMKEKHKTIENNKFEDEQVEDENGELN
jgi:hypothetical protein